MTPFQEIASAIIQKLMFVLGKDIAIARARNVAELAVDDGGMVTNISGDSSSAVDNLIRQYQELLGPAAVSFAKDVALPVIKKNPGLALPRVLQES